MVNWEIISVMISRGNLWIQNIDSINPWIAESAVGRPINKTKCTILISLSQTTIIQVFLNLLKFKSVWKSNITKITLFLNIKYIITLALIFK